MKSCRKPGNASCSFLAQLYSSSLLAKELIVCNGTGGDVDSNVSLTLIRSERVENTHAMTFILCRRMDLAIMCSF